MSRVGARAPQALLRSLATAAALALACTASAGPREDFLRAESRIAVAPDAEALAIIADLDGYVLTPYLELAWAERSVDTLAHARLADLIERHRDVPGAERLRRAWLARLLREQRFEQIVRHHEEHDHTPSACIAATALERVGRIEAAWALVADLWRTARSLPDECDAPLAAWRAAGQLTAQRAWERAALAIDAGNTRLARYLRRDLAGADERLLTRWLELRAAPEDVVAFAREGLREDTRRRDIVLDVFTRAAHRDGALGRRLWDALAPLPLDDALRAQLRERLGEALARDGAPDALEWLDGAHSASALAWGAQLALRERRWQRVASAVAAMPDDERDSERWRYWHGRALRELGDPGGAERLRALARERSYYGFLAADDLGTGYAMQHRDVDTTDAAVQQLERSPPARRAREWLALERSTDARREWEHILRRGDAAQRRAAARLAQRWGWHDAAIRAAAAAQFWDDIELRFPLALPGPVRDAAAGSALPASRIYAVIRQESAFMSDVRSSAGALGLMQLMPATAREVARRAALARPSTHSLLDPQQNLRLGSLYLAGLERRYDGHAVLASAAYNAGPGRVRQWRPRDNALDADAWIENVPFDETRGYLRAVLAYQVIYAHRLGERTLRMRDLMPPVPPTAR